MFNNILRDPGAVKHPDFMNAMQTQTGTILLKWDQSESQTGIKCLNETNHP